MAIFILKNRFRVLFIFLIFLIFGVRLIHSVAGTFNIGIVVSPKGFDSDHDGIPDHNDLDDDNDGINDTIDFFIGNFSFINATTFPLINININGSTNLSRIFNGTYMFNISNGTQILIEFNWTFNSSNVLNLANLSINKQTTLDRGAFEIKNLDIARLGFRKTVYMDRLNTSVNSICIKDIAEASYNNISRNCNAENEILVVCDNKTYSGYICENLGSVFKITGLNHTGILETCTDIDGDGYGTGCSLGSDCNDNNVNINPGANEVCGDSIDNDCDNSADEGCAGAPSGGGGGGGGGAAAPPATTIPPPKVSDFTIDKKTLRVVLKGALAKEEKVVLKPEQTKEETINIKNTGDTVLNITTYLQAVNQFIVSPGLDELKIFLNPSEVQTLNLVFGAKEGQKPDIYTGEILLKSKDIEKTIGIIVEVESANPLFDVDSLVLPQYKSVFPGDNVFVEISLFNIRGFGRVDVALEYSIRDLKGNTITSEHETLAVETEAKFGRELQVPLDTKPGTYVIAVKVNYADSVGLSSDVFEVKAKTIRLYPLMIKDYGIYLRLSIAFIVFSILAIVIYKSLLPKKKYIQKTKEEAHKIIKTEEKIKKLEKEHKALEQAYNSKLISEESYKKGKERIEKDLKKSKERLI